MDAAATVGIGLGSFLLGVLLGPTIWRCFGLHIFALPSPTITGSCDAATGEWVVDVDPKETSEYQFVDIGTELYDTTEPTDPDTATWQAAAATNIRIPYNSNSVQGLKVWCKYESVVGVVQYPVGPCVGP